MDDKPSRFPDPVSESDWLKSMEWFPKPLGRVHSMVSKNTWQEWCQSIGSEFPSKLDKITNEKLNFWLARFVIEAWNKKAEAYEGVA